MSAVSAAKQRLDNLHQQLETYTTRLRRQEEDLYRLTTEMSQTRTVVLVTIPSEIGKAKREYAGAVYALPSPLRSRSTSMLTLCLNWTQVISSMPRDNRAPAKFGTVVGDRLFGAPLR